LKAEVVVFGRWPEPGRVKTRLAAAIGADQATRVYTALLDHTLSETQAAGLPVILSMASEQGMSEWEAPPGVTITTQSGADLGTRMEHAFAERFAAGADAVVLVGSDLPGLSAELILEAVDILGRVPVVLGPAVDGGYWIIGQRRPGHDLFSSVPWSSPSTADATRARLREIELRHEELEELRDLDTVADLEALLTYDCERLTDVAEAIRIACGGHKRR